jgi:hypothetical protein
MQHKMNIKNNVFKKNMTVDEMTQGLKSKGYDVDEERIRSKSK